MYYVGGTVHPGGGMPLALRSGMSVAKKLLMKLERFTIIDISFITIIRRNYWYKISSRIFLKTTFVAILIPLCLYLYRANLQKKEWLTIF